MIIPYSRDYPDKNAYYAALQAYRNRLLAQEHARLNAPTEEPYKVELICKN